MRRALCFLFLLPLVAGCASDVMHCSDAAAGADAPCIQFDDMTTGLLGAGLRASMVTLCQAVGAEPKPGACPSEGRVGGCRGTEQDLYTYTEYVYEAGVGDIVCASDEELVDGEGAPLEGEEASVCSEVGGAAITATFTNATGVTVTMYWVDTDCNEVAYQAIDAGGSVSQQTFVDHAWVGRVGSGNPTGQLVWEWVATAADDGTTVTID